MNVFGRKKKQGDDLEDYALTPEEQALEDAELLAIIDAELAEEESGEDAGDEADEPGEDAGPASDEGAVDEPLRPRGPWDADDAPEDDIPRIDLGALLVPVPDGTEVRVDVSQEGEVVAATLVQGESTMQVNVFAAPRRSGIWGEVRAEIAEALNGGGGKAEEAHGTFGPELRAQVPAEVPGQGVQLAPARFVGIDGPRWFLRALIAGPAATDASVGVGLESVLRDVVVQRGTEAMAVRDPLPLRLPKDVTDAAEAAAQEEEAGGLEMPERGPEITETR